MKNKYLLLFALSLSLLFTNAASAENSDSVATPAPTAKSASVLKLSDEELDVLADLLAERLALLRSETVVVSDEAVSDAVVQEASASEKENTESKAKKHRRHDRSKDKTSTDASSNDTSAAQLENSDSSSDESPDTAAKSPHSSRHKKHRLFNSAP